MPDYYSDGNNVIGPAPVHAPPRPAAPNGLLAGVILAACAAAVAAMVYFQPGFNAGSGGGSVAQAMVYVVAEFDDGSKLGNTGFLVGADGTVLTTWSFVSEKVTAPRKFSVYVDVGRPGQKTVSATLVKSGAPSSSATADERFAGNWALLKISGETKAWPALRPAPAAPQAGLAVKLVGVERNGTLANATDAVQTVVGGDQGLQRFSLAQKAGASTVGGPVLEAKSGGLLGLNVGVMTLAGADGKEAPATTWVLPLSRIAGLGSAGQASN